MGSPFFGPLRLVLGFEGLDAAPRLLRHGSWSLCPCPRPLCSISRGSGSTGINKCLQITMLSRCFLVSFFRRDITAGESPSGFFYWCPVAPEGNSGSSPTLGTLSVHGGPISMPPWHLGPFSWTQQPAIPLTYRLSSVRLSSRATGTPLSELLGLAILVSGNRDIRRNAVRYYGLACRKTRRVHHLAIYALIISISPLQILLY